MMMASSSSSTTSGSVRQQGYTTQKLARQNSSFLGAIKNIVTAPLSWFGHPDGGDATGGKRRRTGSAVVSAPVAGVQERPTDEMVADKDEGCSGDELDESSRRSKRMRLHSPSRTTVSNSTIRRTSVVPRASSVVLPSRTPLRHTHNPPSIQRTMSIDPPQYGLRRDINSNHSFNFGNADIDMTALDSFGDVSMPPSPGRISPRPSFRMRSSITPQPTQQHFPKRHISEPPPLNALLANPVFVHAPPQARESTPAPTLGSLVATARSTLSPVKQPHSSLLFKRIEEDIPAERALQQLDVYKTPLLPTRLRTGSDSITAKVIPDMFRSRRSSRLILMSDDRERSGSKTKGSVVNETKPYAGEGGMKKLLARAKLEAEKEKAKEKENKEQENEGGTSRVGREDPVLVESSPSSLPAPPPPPPDWFKNAGAGAPAPSGSSLRVGRQKTSRNHIQRPSKSRFSASYEDDGDDMMEDDEKAKERQILEEAAKKVPVFNIPAGFSFAKETPAPVPTAADLEKAKDPPIKALPFSFKPSPGSTPEPTKLETESRQPESVLPPTLSSFGVAPLQSTNEKQKTVPPFSLAPLPAPPTNGASVPNFFANSQVLKGATPPSVLHLSATTNTTPTSDSSVSTGASLFGIPSTKEGNESAANPIRDGSNDKVNEVVKPVAGPGPSVFLPIPKAETPAEAASAPTTVPQPPFNFGGPSEVKTAAPSSTLMGPFSFAKSADDNSTFSTPFSLAKPGENLTPTTTMPSATSSTSLPFSFGQPVATDKLATSAALPVPFGTTTAEAEQSEQTLAAPKPIFGATSGPHNLFGEIPKTATTGLFGQLGKGSSQPTTILPPQTTPSPLQFALGPSAPVDVPSLAPVIDVSKPAFTFGPTVSTTTAIPAVDVSAPKPLFGDGAFAFGQEKKEVKSSPFSFGATPSTPPTISEPKPVTPAFAFGSPATTPVPTSTTPAGVPPVSFSFSGGGSAGADVTNKAPFIFGVPGSTATLLERPVTPPKGLDQDLKMEESPVREMQINGNGKAPEARPAIGITTPFSFGSTGSSGVNGTVFGAQGSATTPVSASSTTPFAFGVASSTTSNPFGQKKLEETKAFGGFGAPQAPPINTSFSFGKQQADENRPSSAGTLFTFGQTPTSATNPTPTFSFGGSSNPFAASTTSAPASPSTFAQSSPFNFGAAPVTSSPFAFGSQPSSPAAGANATLPPANATGFGQTSSPSSPFTAPLPLAASTSGGAVFTIGAAPPPAPPGRQIKKLPRRVPGKR